MTKAQDVPSAVVPAVRKETYKGHEIVIPEDQRRKKIFIDGRPVRWSELRGSFYLDVYAYDRGRTLEETIKRYIDYLEKCARPTKEGR
jgi:hypothetical protein